MIVNYQKEIEFINDCGCLFDEDELSLAIFWFTQKPVARLKKIFMYGNYPGISIYDNKIHVHRLLKMYELRRELDSNEYVHHIDRNKLNALSINLALMSSNEHQSLLAKGRKQKKEHIIRRINATSKTRYGRIVYENQELVK